MTYKKISIYYLMMTILMSTFIFTGCGKPTYKKHNLEKLKKYDLEKIMYLKKDYRTLKQGDKVAVKYILGEHNGYVMTDKGIVAKYNLSKTKNISKKMQKHDSSEIRYSLTIDAPKDARVRIMNIKPKYKDGILLKKGKYHIKVTKSGFKTYDNWITLNEDKNLDVTLKKESILANVALSLNENTTWEAGNDFAAGYFDVFYENNLFYAIPSIYTNKLQNLIVNYKKLKNCQRNRISENQFIKAKTNDIENSQKRHSAPLYKNGEKVGVLNNISIDGLKDWRLPTLKEIQKSSYVSKFQLGLSCWGRNYNTKFYHYYTALDIITYTKGGTRNGIWSVINSGFNSNDTSSTWVHEVYAGDDGLVVLVREPSKIDKKIFNKYSAKNYKKRIYAYAKALTEKQTKAKKKILNKPKLLTKPSKPKLTKDEFETTTTFNKRVENATIKWKKEIAIIKQKNSDLIANYKKEKKNVEQEYKKQTKLFSSKEYQSKIYKQSFKRALQVVLGKPYFKNIKYDADTQIMSGIVFSARIPYFKEIFEVSVPITEAKKFKKNLLDSNLIPVIKMDRNLKVIHVDMVTNSKKIELDYLIAKSKHTVDAYQHFINKYSKSPQAKEADNAIKNIEEKERLYKQQRAKEERQRQERRAKEKQRKQDSYYAKKRIGDKVCKDGTTALILSITITAYVERLNGNSMQLRISDTEGTTPHFNGVTLYKNTLIWDNYNNWYKCNY